MANHPFHGRWRCVIVNLKSGIKTGICYLDIDESSGSAVLREGTYTRGAAPERLTALKLTNDEIRLKFVDKNEYLSGIIVSQLASPDSKILAGFFFVGQRFVDLDREIENMTIEQIQTVLYDQDDGTWHGTNP